MKEKWQIKPEPNRGTKITTRTPFLSGEDEADFSDVYLVDKSALYERARGTSAMGDKADISRNALAGAFMSTRPRKIVR